MKKYFFYFLMLLTLVVLITRFVQVQAPLIEVSKPNFVCQPNESPTTPDGARCEIIAQINQNYLKNIKPIFEQKCLMCHGSVATMPLYSKLPGASWLIKSDIEEAKEHLDMSYDYPFYSEKKEMTLLEQFNELRGVIKKNEMPPLIYLTLHWQSRLSNQEKEVIMNWVEESQKLLSPSQN